MVFHEKVGAHAKDYVRQELLQAQVWHCVSIVELFLIDTGKNTKQKLLQAQIWHCILMAKLHGKAAFN